MGPKGTEKSKVEPGNSSKPFITWKPVLLILSVLTALHLYLFDLPELSSLRPWLAIGTKNEPTSSNIGLDLAIAQYVKSVKPISPEEALELCPIVDSISATDDNYAFFRTNEFREHALKSLIGAVNIPTESLDDLGAVGEDPRWKVFSKFEEYLKDTFPAVHQHLTLDHVNSHGLVYTWKGSDETLKPVLLAAHQDVVPVLPDTRGLWDHDPYNAYFDGEIIWGRGVSDDKNPLIGIMQSIEILLTREPEFIPKRTIIAAFGFDEEISGHQGARQIGLYLEKLYGKNSFEAIVDEGGQGVMEYKGVKLASPGVGEKGYFDSSVVLHTPGGHSSMPPDHTSIGIMGALARLIEDTPFPPKLTTSNPFFKFLQCLAVHSPELNEQVKQAIFHSGDDPIANKLVTKFVSKSRLTRYNIQTSQALDVIRGGLKVNALPEEVTLLTNFRISTDSSVGETREKIIGNVKEIAELFDLGLQVNRTTFEHPGEKEGAIFSLDQILPPTKKGQFIVSDYGSHIEPAPVSPFTGDAWQTLAGTIRHVFEIYAGPIVNPITQQISSTDSDDHQNVIVAPSLMTANTDTKHYWSLSPNIFRFTPLRVLDKRIGNIHTVNEHLQLDIHLETIVFYYSYIKNLSK